MTDPNSVLLPIDQVRHLFDLVVGSMDFGSGFLDDEDIDLLRTIAVRLGVDPDTATPRDWKHKYPHAYQAPAGADGYYGYLVVDRCTHCMRARAFPCHQETP